MSQRRSADGPKPARKRASRATPAPKSAPTTKPAAKRAAGKKPDQAGVAQPEEQRPSKPTVAGSRPAARSKQPKPTAPKAREARATVAKLLQAEPAPEFDADGLRPEWRRFLELYLIDFNGTRAYMEVYPNIATPAAAAQCAWRLLRHAKVRAVFLRRQREFYAKLSLTREEITGQLAAIIEADPNELSQVRHVACPHCWGNKPTPRSRSKRSAGADEVADEAKTRVSEHADPDPDCGHCEGEGVVQYWTADTRKLSAHGRALFAGVKVTPSGVQMLTESKDAAREKLMRLMGLFEKDNAQRATPLLEAVQTLMSGIHSENTGSLPVKRAEP